MRSNRKSERKRAIWRYTQRVMDDQIAAGMRIVFIVPDWYYIKDMIADLPWAVDSTCASTNQPPFDLIMTTGIYEQAQTNQSIPIKYNWWYRHFAWYQRRYWNKMRAEGLKMKFKSRYKEEHQ